jgi:hypothetical protein
MLTSFAIRRSAALVEVAEAERLADLFAVVPVVALIPALPNPPPEPSDTPAQAACRALAASAAAGRFHGLRLREAWGFREPGWGEGGRDRRWDARRRLR